MSELRNDDGPNEIWEQPTVPSTTRDDAQYLGGSYDVWWRGQVRMAMPYWVHGTRANDFTDGYVHWPLSPEQMLNRLIHLSTLRAHE